MINLLEAAVVAVMVLFAIAGFRKGFVKKFAAMVSLALSIVLVSALLPYITQYLKKNTPVYTFLVEQCTGNYGKTGAEQPYRFGKRSRNEFRICRRCLCQYGAG